MEQVEDQICRACMIKAKKNQKMYFIYDPPSEIFTQSIANLLLITNSQLDIQSNDELPKTICKKCLNTLLALADFQEMCYISQCELVQMFGATAEAQTEIDTDSSEVMPPTDPLEIEEIILEDMDPLQRNDCLVNKDEVINVLRRRRSRDRIKRSTILASTHNVFCSDIYNKNGHLTELNTDSPEKFRKTRAKKQTSAGENGTETDSTVKKFKSQIFSEDRKYKCEYCNKGYKHPYKLREHIRVHTGERPYLCTECGQAYRDSNSLKAHVRRHAGIESFECSDCPKKFVNRSQLWLHKAVHAQIKSHTCGLCGASFTRAASLKQHELMHTGEKPYKCEYCDMRFTDSSNAQRHKRIHTGVKPFKCEYCVQAFTQSSNLVEHLRTHIGKNIYRCEVCPQRFPLARDAREHFATHKNDDEATRLRNLKALQEDEASMKATLKVHQHVVKNNQKVHIEAEM